MRLASPSNTPDETDYQSPAAAQLCLKPPLLPHKKLRHITIAGRTPADRNAASVQPMERANGIQSSSRRHPKEGSDDVDAVVRPDMALGFHPKSWNRGCAGGGLHGGASKEVTRCPRTPTPPTGKIRQAFARNTSQHHTHTRSTAPLTRTPPTKSSRHDQVEATTYLTDSQDAAEPDPAENDQIWHPTAAATAQRPPKAGTLPAIAKTSPS